MLDQSDELPADRTVADLVVDGRAEHEWAGDARVRDVIAGLIAGLVGDIPWEALVGDSQRRPAPPRRARRAADPRLGRRVPRRADQPPRRRGRRLAGTAPEEALAGELRRARGRHPRPVVPRRGLDRHLGGARRRSSSPSRAGMPRTSCSGSSATGRPPPASRAARTCCAKSWPGCDAGRPPGRPSRSSGWMPRPR